jgi:gas vesicle protein
VNERGSGMGSFLLGLGIGAALGFLFAPEPGGATRSKVTRRLRGLRDLAAEKAGEWGQLLEAAEDQDEDEVPARELLERRLGDATRRRRGAKPGSKAEATPSPATESRRPSAMAEDGDDAEEEDEPRA